jgi:type I restriction enzyme S subunit
VFGGVTRTGGRAATEGVIPGRWALSVARPPTPAPREWTWVPLTDVARLESGYTPSRKKPEYWDGDIPWIGIRAATANHGRVLMDTEQHTNALGIENSSARLLPKHTVCLSRTASVGYVVVTGRPMATWPTTSIFEISEP